MLVVVVVVSAMQSENELGKIGSTEFVVRRDDNSHNSNGVNSRVYIQDLDVECGQGILARFERLNGQSWETVTEYLASVYSSEKAITLKSDAIESNDIQPGEKLRLVVFEEYTDSLDEFQDSTDIIDRCNVRSDVSTSDGVATCLQSVNVSDYLEGEEKRLIFKNARNGKKKSAMVEEYDGDRARFQFPRVVRDTLEVEVGDLVEVIEPTTGTDNMDNASELKRIEAKVDVIYDMLVDLYEVEVMND